MGYSIYISKGEEIIKLPVNPEKLEIGNGQEVAEHEIVKLGAVVEPLHMHLRTYSFTVELPHSVRSYCEPGQFYDSSHCLNTIRAWRESLEPIRLVITSDVYRLSELVLITELDIEEVAGEEGDYYVTFKFTEFKPFELIEGPTVAKSDSPNPSQPTKPRQSNPPKPNNNMYTVAKGDTLWSISKRFLGSGSKHTVLYEANKSVIGKNPNVIKVGMKLTIPKG